MKRNINPTVLVFSLIFSCYFSNSILAQSISKVYTQEVKATENGTVQLKGKTLDFRMQGTIHSMCGEEGYIIKSKKNEPPLLTIANLKVETWNKQVVQQSIIVKVTPVSGSEEIAKELLNNLKLNLDEDSKGFIKAKNNLNIKEFQMINGIFKRNRTTLLLENGKSFDIQKLEISSTLTVPKNHNLEVKLENMHLELEDLEGNLKLGSSGGNLKAGKIKNLEANLFFGNLEVKEIENAIINAHNSIIKVKKIKSLKIGPTQVGLQNALGTLFHKTLNDVSSLNTFHIQEVDILNIQESTGDNFHLGTVKSIESLNSLFTNYKIDTLRHVLHLKSKSGDLTVKSIQNELQEIDIFSEVSNISLGVNNIENCLFQLQKNRAQTLKIPQNFIKQENDLFDNSIYLKGNKNKAREMIIRCFQCEINLN